MAVRMGKTFLAGLLFLGCFSMAQAALKTSLSDTKIQNVLENYFPINEYAAFARVSMHKPKVDLQKGNKSIVLIVPVVANVAGDTARHGQAIIGVKLAYKPPTGGLYFSQPKIQKFEMSGVGKKMLARLREIIKLMIENSLPVVRIYTLKERDLNHSLAKSALKSSSIENGKLDLEFGFN